jgi:RNA polymerase sigma factor (sigma-70 family)
MRDGLIVRNGNNDNSLLELIRGNDNRAFTLLYKRYWGPLLNFASHYLHDKDSCEEIVQELFVQLHVQEIPSRIRTSLSSYLYTALRNKIFNYLRNRAIYLKHVRIAARNGGHSQNNVEQFINMKQLEERIASFLDGIPGKYREVYVLRDREQCTIKRISQLLNRPVNTVEKQIRKTSHLLRNFLKQAN